MAHARCSGSRASRFAMDGRSASPTTTSFGRPYLFDTQLERSPLGEVIDRVAVAAVVLADPAARVVGDGRARRSTIRRSFAARTSTRSRWMSSVAAGRLNAVYRIGGGSYGVFAGAQVGGDRVAPADAASSSPSTGSSTIRTRRSVHATRTQNRTLVAAILGARALSFFKAQGFDALEGAQDVASGMQFGALFGRGVGSELQWAGSSEARCTPAPERHARSSACRRVVETGRSDGDWSDMIAEGRLAWYSRPTKRRTQIASLEYSGAWDTSVPFQLRLGTDRVGVRGYEDSRTVGGRRAVARLEERLSSRASRSISGFGGAAFVDAGKMWAGDVPFGETVNPRVGAGVGLDLRRAAFEPSEPARRRRRAARSRMRARSGA